jgi:deaminated glutathione amidase
MGRVVVGMGEQEGAVVGAVDADRVAEVRAVNPSLANRRWDVQPRSA